MILEYSYPRLHTGKSWYVDFYCYDPALQKMRRKKIMLDSISNKSQRRRRATEIITRLYDKLSSGWNPWCDSRSDREYTTIDDVFDKYVEYVSMMDRIHSRENYTSRMNILKIYLGSLNFPPKYIYQFNLELVTDFLDWLRIERKVGERTYNNYRGWMSSLCEWLVLRQYIPMNFVGRIPKLRQPEKKRDALTSAHLNELWHYLSAHDKPFLLACMMEYYTFIRPSELVNLKVGDVSVMNQTIFVSAKYSKNRRDSNVGLNQEILKLMIDLKVLEKPVACYLFSKDFLSGSKKLDSDAFNKHWKTIRNKLGWPDSYQFYSLKDSGIRDLANSVGIVVARDQARHSDISTTNKYLCGRDKNAPEAAKNFVGILKNK